MGFVRVMKRVTAVILAAGLLLPLFPVVSFAEGMIVYENGFESDLGGYTAAGDTKVECSNEQAYSGNYSMKVYAGSADWHGAKLLPEDARMSVDAVYDISAMLYSKSQKQVVMQITLIRPDGSKDYKWLNSPTLEPGEWTEYSASISLASAEYSAIDSITFENKTEPFGTAFYVDDVKIVKMGDLEPFLEEESKPEMPVIDFEDGDSSGFVPRGGDEVLKVTDEQSYSAGYSLKTTNRTKAWHGPTLHVEEYIAQGKEYVITVWVHALSPSSSKFKLSTQIGEGDGASYINLASAAVSVSDGWVKLEGKYHYANTASGYITIYVENDNVNAEYYIDDISVVEMGAFEMKADLTLPSLAEIYKNDFMIGGIFSNTDLAGIRFEMIKHHFNALTAENVMKPGASNPEKGKYNFDAVDGMLKTIADAGISVHGHVLAWHQQSAAFLNMDTEGNPLSREEAEKNLIESVSNIAGHYKGKVISWDVLNEAISDNPSNPTDWRGALRQSDSPWYMAFANGGDGVDYIEMLFREARKADPDAILYYNDYNLDNQNKAAAVASMVKEINDKYLAEGNTRLLIDGVGMQGHYSMSTIVDNVERSIQRFKDIGVEVSITELDVTVPNASVDGLTEEQELRQALKYAQLFVIFKKYSDTIARVTIWGLDDGTSWRGDRYPLWFNADLSAKAAYYAVADPEGFLASYEEPEREPVLQGNAAYGSPAMDGAKDEIWQKSQELQVSQMLQAWQTASGTARVLWDESNLYVLLEVSANELDSTSLNPWECSSVEVFVDEANCKGNAYAADDGQYRVSYENVQTFGGTTNGEGFESAVSVDGSSYIVEMKIPFKEVSPEAGMKVGFDAQINDAAGGARIGVAMWCDTTGSSFENTTKWGEVTLLDKDGSANTSSVQTPPAEGSSESAQEKSSLKFSDWMLILAGAVVAVVGGAYVYRYVRKRREGKK